jgi:hypothetical protein
VTASIILALALAQGPATPPAPVVWRVVNRPGLHVGVRPAVHISTDQGERAAGATLQVTLRLP